MLVSMQLQNTNIVILIHKACTSVRSWEFSDTTGSREVLGGWSLKPHKRHNSPDALRLDYEMLV